MGDATGNLVGNPQFTNALRVVTSSPTKFQNVPNAAVSQQNRCPIVYFSAMRKKNSPLLSFCNGGYTLDGNWGKMYHRKINSLFYP